MTEPGSPTGEELKSEPTVLELLGFGIPTPLADPVPLSMPDSAVPASPAQQAPAEPAPATTRREMRERERALGVSATPTPTSDRRGARQGAARPGPRRGARGPALPRPTASRARTVGSRWLSFGAMTFAAALAIGMSVPANAFNTGADLLLAEVADAGPAQTVEVDDLETSLAGRDGWSVTSWAEMLRARYGTRDFSYTVGTGAIRWPFPYAVPISSGFGERVAPCRSCSTYHQGLDFNPGYGAPIYAIADGVVTIVDDGFTGFGNYVTISHQIDGETVSSTYAHMQRGSSPLVVGEEILVGDFIGLVGQTGQATGAHLHFEIQLNGVKVDPFAWLQAMAG